MKIVHHSPNLLILRQRPVILWICGVVFASGGLFAVADSAKVTTFTCRRTESANCQLVESGFLGAQSKEIPLNILQGAKVEEDDDYRVVILTSSGEVPFTSYFNGDESHKQAIVSHIKNFISNPEITSLTETQDDRLWTSLVAGIVIAAGFIMLVVPVKTCVFDKALNTLTLKRQGLLGTKVIEHRLHKIKDVQVEESTDSEGSTYRVIILVGCERLSLCSSDKKSKQETIASYIKSFLNLNH